MNDNRTVLNALAEAVDRGEYRAHGDQMDFECPNCRDSCGHFALDTKRLLFNCWKCGFSGRIHYESITADDRRILWSLKQRAPVKPKVVLDDVDRMIPVMEVLQSSVPQLLTASPIIQQHAVGLARSVVDYCTSRGMDEGQISKYQVSIRLFDNRVYFPYWDDSRKVTWFSGRALDNSEPKTLEPSNSDKPLFGWHVTDHHQLPFAVLVEGIFDHLVTPNSYAIMGSVVSSIQVMQLMLTKAIMVFVIGDPDASYKMRVTRKRLADVGIKATLVHLVDTDKDPNELGFGFMASLVQNLRSLVSYRRPLDLRVCTGDRDPYRRMVITT